MKDDLTSAMRVSGISVAADRYVSVNGPPTRSMPLWGLTVKTAEVEYHLHPAITYELHYQVPFYIFVHTYNRGEGLFAVGDAALHPWASDPGGSCLIPPNMPIRIVQSTPLEFLALGLSPAFFDRIAGAEAGSFATMSDIFKTNDPALAALCAEMRRSMIAETLGQEAYLDALATAMLTRLVNWHLLPPSDRREGAETLSPAVARRIAHAIEDTLSGTVRVAKLAEIAGLSRSHFSRAFSHKFGVTPQSYILSRRVARVRSLLVETERSVSEIAISCGFSTPSHLTKAFKHELGLTPSAYRAALRPEES